MLLQLSAGKVITQLSQRDRVMLRVTEYFAKSLKVKVIENGNIRKLGYGFLFAFCSNYGSVLYHSVCLSISLSVCLSQWQITACTVVQAVV